MQTFEDDALFEQYLEEAVDAFESAWTLLAMEQLLRATASMNLLQAAKIYELIARASRDAIVEHRDHLIEQGVLECEFMMSEGGEA